MPSCNTYHLTWVSFTLDMGYLFTVAPAKHSHSSKAQPLLLNLDEGYLLTVAFPDLQHGIAPLGSPVPAQPSLLGLLLLASSVCGSSQLPTPALVSGWLLRLTTTGLGCWVASPGRRPDLGQGVFPPGRHWPRPLGSSSRPPSRSRMLGGSSLPFLRRCSLALWAAVPDFRGRVALSCA